MKTKPPAQPSGIAAWPADDRLLARGLEALTDAFWHYPYELAMGDPRVWQLYQENSPRVDIFLPKDQTGLALFAINDTDKRSAALILENDFWMLWGFQHGPKQMTTEGRQLFINAVYRTMQ